MRLLGQFRAAGLPAFPGWRYYEDMRGLALAPDGMVNLNRSPYGPGWHFVEYERAARSPASWRRKLRGLAARQRRNRWPALFVCFNDQAEQNLHQVAGELGLRGGDDHHRPAQAGRAPSTTSIVGLVMGIESNLADCRRRALPATRCGLWSCRRETGVRRLSQPTFDPVDVVGMDQPMTPAQRRCGSP